MNRAADARDTFAALEERKPTGYLAVAASLGEAEAAVALGRSRQGARASTRGSRPTGPSSTSSILARQAETARVLGDRRKTAETLLRIYYEFPLTDAAIAAAAELEPLRDIVVRQGYKLDLGRAVQLYAARRYSDARAAFAALQGEVSGDDRELVDLRIAESDFFLQRHAAALDGLRPWLDRGSRQAEARFFTLSALRGLGRDDEFLSQTQALVRDFPESSWSEEALNNLGTYYILKNDDAMAAKAFDQLFEKFPNGQRAERAAWKSGWWAYKNAEYAATVRIFEAAAASFPRSDYRPLFLYWSARSHAKLGTGADAESRLRLVVTDYGNRYYGRLAGRLLSRSAQTTLAADAVPAARQSAAVRPAEPPNAGVIRLLLASELYDDALNELRYAQRTGGSSPVVDATIAWAYHRKGELRRAITLMRRAYPQHLTADQALPKEILQVIFPLTYWDLIRKHAAARNLDPVSGGGAHRPGVDVRRRGPLVGQCVGADADRAGDRPAAREIARHPALHHLDADQSGNQYPDGHALFLAARAAVRRHLLRARQLQRRREPRRALEGRTPGPRRRRVHRRHPVPRDAELRQAHPGNCRGLPAVVRQGRRTADSRAGGCPEASGGRVSSQLSAFSSQQERLLS